MTYFAFETGRAPIHAPNGMCATSHPLASRAAIDVLESGGNAVDAALTASAVLCVVEPMMTGLGGDCFALVAMQGGGRIDGINGSGRAPQGLKSEDLRDLGYEGMPLFDVHSVTIPGAVDAWSRLHDAYGTMEFGEILAPAIKAAEDGFAVTPRVAHDWTSFKGRLGDTNAGRQHWLLDGAVPGPDDVFRSPGMVESLRMISARGRDGFYKGDLAADMVRTLKACGGRHTFEDFASTQSSSVTPIHTAYGGYNVWELPPNGRGLTALLMLNMLSCLDFSSLDPLGADRLHLQVEAQRLAYKVCDGAIGDPDFTEVPVDQILSMEFAAGLAARIDPAQRSAFPDPVPADLSRETVYISVVDRDRNAVSFINSIYYGFGSGIVSDRYGITFQNRGAGFSLVPGHPNELAGGKRPQHTIIPALLTDATASSARRIVMPFGVMGGDYQPMGHVQVLTNILEFGMDVQQAIDMPRLLFDGQTLLCEPAFEKDILADLERRGHSVEFAPEPLGGGQAIWIDWKSGDLVGGSDPRKDGCAIGY